MFTMICAGDAVIIEEWKNWFLTPILGVGTLPRVERTEPDGTPAGITISLLNKPESKILFTWGVYITFENVAKFSGTGAPHALECYRKNRCGKLSVSSAAAFDPATGGATKFVELETNRHNLSKTLVSLAEANQQLHSRGMVMNMTTKKVVQFKDYATAHGIPQAGVSGEISLSAPTGEPYRPWTDSEKRELQKVLEGIAAVEAAAGK